MQKAGFMLCVWSRYFRGESLFLHEVTNFLKIICAILSKYYTLTYTLTQNWEQWYIREVSMAIIVYNLLLCPPLLRKVAGIRYFTSSTKFSSKKSLPGDEIPKLNIQTYSHNCNTAAVVQSETISNDYYKEAEYMTQTTNCFMAIRSSKLKPTIW
jgi:hypothetical protein